MAGNAVEKIKASFHKEELDQVPATPAKPVELVKEQSHEEKVSIIRDKITKKLHEAKQNKDVNAALEK